jgi:hypothetical protein
VSRSNLALNKVAVQAEIEELAVTRREREREKERERERERENERERERDKQPIRIIYASLTAYPTSSFRDDRRHRAVGPVQGLFPLHFCPPEQLAQVFLLISLALSLFPSFFPSISGRHFRINLRPYLARGEEKTVFILQYNKRRRRSIHIRRSILVSD